MEDDKSVDEFVNKKIQEEIETTYASLQKVKSEITKVLVGQDKMISLLLEALLARGHVLLEGVPGVGKTLLIKALSSTLNASNSRVQFTPDLLPSDIIGVRAYEKSKGFFTMKGPVFANFILGDEINRAPPKVQSSLLQAMQEYEVTIGKETFDLPLPFFVMATQNPLDHQGTYKLPEAQMDRFLFKIQMTYPDIDSEQIVLENNISLDSFDSFKLKKIFTNKQLLKAQTLVKEIYVDEKIKNYIVRVIDSTRNPKMYGLEKVEKYVSFGASPRGSISLFIAAKARALLNGRPYVTYKDVKEQILPTLRHRLILNFEGQAMGVSTDDVLDEVIKRVPLM